MKVTEDMMERAARAAAFPQIQNEVYVLEHLRRGLEAALSGLPEPNTLAGYWQGRKDEYEHAKARYEAADRHIAMLDDKLARIGTDMPEMLALCEHKDANIAELEEKIAKVRALLTTEVWEGSLYDKVHAAIEGVDPEMADILVPARIRILGPPPSAVEGKIFEITFDEHNGEVRLNELAEELLRGSLKDPIEHGGPEPAFDLQRLADDGGFTPKGEP